MSETREQEVDVPVRGADVDARVKAAITIQKCTSPSADWTAAATSERILTKVCPPAFLQSDRDKDMGAALKNLKRSAPKVVFPESVAPRPNLARYQTKKTATPATAGSPKWVAARRSSTLKGSPRTVLIGPRAVQDADLKGAGLLDYVWRKLHSDEGMVVEAGHKLASLDGAVGVLASAHAVPGLPRCSRVCAGGYFGLAVAEADGALWAWGLLGGRLRWAPERVALPGGRRAASIACGAHHAAAVDDAGRAYTWGRGSEGCLGHGAALADTDVDEPREVAALSRAGAVAAVCAGAAHSVALTREGEVYTWGSAERGQLGRGASATASPTPKLVRHTLALVEGGRVAAFGAGSYGQLGAGQPGADEGAPTLVEGLRGVAEVSCGGDHSLAVTDAGDVLAWGWNGAGQLGVGDTADRFSPAQQDRPLGAPNVTPSVHGGAYSNSYNIYAGEVFAYGSDEMGVNGDLPADGARTRPVRVEGLPGDVVWASGGFRHSVFLDSKGVVYALGDNSFGQLGSERPPSDVPEATNLYAAPVAAAPSQ
eukprot:m51a1_g2127 hypothetical protein (540) ;mRNA; f:1691298-1693880